MDIPVFTKRHKSKTKGISKHPLYLVRRSMIHRCYNPKVKCYYRYGGRGIKVCDEWIESQEAFIEYCESIGWQQGLQMDRINNDGDYEPFNIRFVTPKENSRNTRTNVRITINGVTKILEDWCQFYGVPSKSFHARVNICGWSVEKAISTPMLKIGEGLNKKILSMDAANEVREKYKKGGVYQWELAKEYGVSTTKINEIVLNKSLKHKI